MFIGSSQQGHDFFSRHFGVRNKILIQSQNHHYWRICHSLYKQYREEAKAKPSQNALLTASKLKFNNQKLQQLFVGIT